MDSNSPLPIVVLPSNPALDHARHAFVTWVILDKKYFVGALALASSLQQHCPGIQRVCLVSRDLSADAAPLQQLFHVVVAVDLLEVDVQYLRGRRFEHFYAPWINWCFTRLQSLRLGELLGLEKIIVLDADTLILGDISPLFDLPPPAGILSLEDGSKLPNGKVFYHDHYHGKKIPKQLLEFAATTNYGIRGCLMLLRPSGEDFFKFIEMLRTLPPNQSPSAIGSFGDPALHIGPDELFLSRAYGTDDCSGWTHISERYMATAWQKCSEPRLGLHFVSAKPWCSKEYYPDYDWWYREVLHMRRNYPALAPLLSETFVDKLPKNSRITAAEKSQKMYKGFPADAPVALRRIVDRIGTLKELPPHSSYTLDTAS